MVEWLREQSNEELSPADIVGVLNAFTAAKYQESDYAGAETVAEVARNYAERVLSQAGRHPCDSTAMWMSRRVHRECCI